MFDSCCIPLYADIIKGFVLHYAYTNMYNVKHHVDFFVKRDGKSTGIPCGMQMFWVDPVTFFPIYNISMLKNMVHAGHSYFLQLRG